jgi:hypothetical protein
MQPRSVWFVAPALVLATGCSAGSPASTSGDAGAPASDAASTSVSDAAPTTVHVDATAETSPDAHATAEASADACAGIACNTHPQTFFVTRAAYSPAFDPNQTGTPGGADDLCVAAASAAGLTGNFVAWIWDPTLNKPTIVQPGLPEPGPWYATDGTTVLFPTPASLEGFPQAPIALDEYGQPVAAGETVWTGMGVGGQGGDTCCNWTAYCALGSALAVYGQTGTTTQAWIDAADGDCSGSTQRHLYCIEAD